MVIGVGGWWGTRTFLHYTTTLEYCTSCHELAPVVEEYMQSAHYSSPSGVRAVCADCHVPEPFWPSVVDHAHALVELWRHYDGTIETPEQFEENRLRLARQVWAEMEESNSRECRTCHVPAAFDFARQTDAAREQMEPLAHEDGGNCITCHRGLVHALPDMEAAAAAEQAAALAALSAPEGDLADVMYVTETAPLALSADPAAPPAAQVLPGTDVAVLGADGDMVHVRLTGFEQEGAAQVMYALAGKRIINTSMQADAQAAVDHGATELDPATGINWTATTLEGWIPRARLTGDGDALWSYADQTYRNGCGVCHTPHNTNEFPANQWMGQMQAMRDRTSITPEQYRLVLRYLQLNSRDVADASAQ
ncbi:MAG: NapC/NirT family cytochrome c [Rhodospirillaceae bacterium]|nr:NapC/NirT family cytochrome c [Rhodospirillaceae bacterium]